MTRPDGAALDDGYALLAEIEAFCRAKAMPETTFGRRCMGDAALIRSLREGRVIRPQTVSRVRAWMAKHADEVAPKPPRPPADEAPICLASEAATKQRHVLDSHLLLTRIVALYDRDARRRGIGLEEAMFDQLYPGWRERRVAA